MTSSLPIPAAERTKRLSGRQPSENSAAPLCAGEGRGIPDGIFVLGPGPPVRPADSAAALDRSTDHALAKSLPAPARDHRDRRRVRGRRERLHRRSPVDASAFAAGSCVAFEPTAGERGKTVFLDAGHGGIDPGGVGSPNRTDDRRGERDAARGARRHGAAAREGLSRGGLAHPRLDRDAARAGRRLRRGAHAAGRPRRRRPRATSAPTAPTRTSSSASTSMPAARRRTREASPPMTPTVPSRRTAYGWPNCCSTTCWRP